MNSKNVSHIEIAYPDDDEYSRREIHFSDHIEITYADEPNSRLEICLSDTEDSEYDCQSDIECEDEHIETPKFVTQPISRPWLRSDVNHVRLDSDYGESDDDFPIVLHETSDKSDWECPLLGEDSEEESKPASPARNDPLPAEPENVSSSDTEIDTNYDSDDDSVDERTDYEDAVEESELSPRATAIKLAAELVNSNKMSLGMAARKFHVPKSTLFDHVHGISTRFIKGRKRTFIYSDELKIAREIREWIQEDPSTTVLLLRRLVFEVAERNKVQHDFDRENRLAGRKWMSLFLQRHKIELPKRQSRKAAATSKEVTNAERGAGTSKNSGTRKTSNQSSERQSRTQLRERPQRKKRPSSSLGRGSEKVPRL